MPRKTPPKLILWDELHVSLYGPYDIRNNSVARGCVQNLMNSFRHVVRTTHESSRTAVLSPEALSAQGAIVKRSLRPSCYAIGRRHRKRFCRCPRVPLRSTPALQPTTFLPAVRIGRAVGVFCNFRVSLCRNCVGPLPFSPGNHRVALGLHDAPRRRVPRAPSYPRCRVGMRTRFLARRINHECSWPTDNRTGEAARDCIRLRQTESPSGTRQCDLRVPA